MPREYKNYANVSESGTSVRGVVGETILEQHVRIVTLYIKTEMR